MSAIDKAETMRNTLDLLLSQFVNRNPSRLNAAIQRLFSMYHALFRQARRNLVIVGKISCLTQGITVDWSDYLYVAPLSL